MEAELEKGGKDSVAARMNEIHEELQAMGADAAEGKARRILNGSFLVFWKTLVKYNEYYLLPISLNKTVGSLSLQPNFVVLYFIVTWKWIVKHFPHRFVVY